MNGNTTDMRVKGIMQGERTMVHFLSGPPPPLPHRPMKLHTVSKCSQGISIKRNETDYDFDSLP